MIRSLTRSVLAVAIAFGAAAVTTPTVSYAQSSESLAQLQTELDALDTMTDTIGPMRKSAEIRLQQMNAFLKQSGKTNDEVKWSSDNPTTFHALSFQQAYSEAVKQQGSRGAAKPSTDDQDLLGREVNAQKVMTKDQWSVVNKLHQQVQQRTDFIRSIKGMNDYEKFAAEATKKRMANHTPAKRETDRQSEQGGITPAQRQANIEKYQNQQATLRRHWDHYHFTFATSDGPPPGGPFRGFTEDANNQYGDENNGYSYDNDDYYDGSYYNGYADPYYDVWGRHHGIYPREAARDGDRIHEAYDRGSNPHPPIEPQSAHPANSRIDPDASSFPAAAGAGRRR
ncbi:MAG: hypothetical protein P8I44_04025 [Phycisphaerales bacterium]|nr:hypothetical protein [Phycisphaerales bacterium]